MKTGKVWLVGAGPGSISLLTIKAAEVLQKADVIIYDSLIGTEILSALPKTADYIYVGKRSGQHTMPQEEINLLLLKEAQKGRFVVRLKGGDPFLFGRGGEELELLKNNQIPFEIVPGITSPIAVPEYNG
ncbi:tetrapyrrole methylase, partial [Anaerostipes caccae]|uniref:uroporphyrinogen-III C-methyltransferase n=1 Tax=Anaerostipes caccae TaxID=105841 RepID=UPI0001F015F5